MAFGPIRHSALDYMVVVSILLIGYMVVLYNATTSENIAATQQSITNKRKLTSENIAATKKTMTHSSIFC